MIGEIRTIGGRRNSDSLQPEPANQTAPAALDALAALDDGPTDDGPTDDRKAVEQFDAGQTLEPAGVVRGRVDTPGKADTDPNGDWIPPILRGIAPDAREQKTNLPQRRRPTD